MKTPVAIIIFNRPELTRQVFAEIKKAKPSKLLIIADGPRNAEEGKLCRETREIVEKINWKCKVYKNYSDRNLGTRKRISSGLQWIFGLVERAIILEDDCVPDFSFFQFCEELLDKYENDERVMAISGNNFQLGRNKIDYSYYFSRNFHLWGWATWKRVYDHYDVAMRKWPEVKKNKALESILSNRREVSYWKRIFDRIYYKKLDVWAYQWVLSCWMQNGLCILPNKNLVTNVGFGEFATRTKFRTKFSNIPAKKMNFPLNHPDYIVRNADADKYTLKLFSKRSLLMDYAKAQLWKLLNRSE